MKRFISVLTVLMAVALSQSAAQNLQLHYDFGRNAATTTVEMFRPDAGGSTFFFVDFWREARPWQNTQFIFLAEPQLWVNLRNIKGWEKINLSFGSELELSCNFVAKGFHAMPTIAAKWTF